MRVSMRALVFVGAVMILALAQSASPAKTQSAPPAKAPAKKDYRAGYSRLAKLPDWSGTWAPDWSTLFPRGTPRARPAGPQLTPEGQKLLDAYRAGQKEGKNLQTLNANCLPPGMPSIMRMPYPIEFVFSPERVTLIAETDSQVRRIFTDGRPLPDDPDPTFNGSSIGHWEGNVLVVETIALNAKNDLMSGLKATDKTRIVERFHEDKPGVIIVDTTITDPTLFAQPYVLKQAYARKPGWAIREYVCEENNHDKADEFGRPSMDLN